MDEDKIATMEAALREFIMTINDTGGVTRDPKGYVVPVV